MDTQKYPTSIHTCTHIYIMLHVTWRTMYFSRFKKAGARTDEISRTILSKRCKTGRFEVICGQVRCTKKKTLDESADRAASVFSARRNEIDAFSRVFRRP